MARGFGLADRELSLLNRVASDFPPESVVLEFVGGVIDCNEEFWSRQILSYLLGVVAGRWDLRKWQDNDLVAQNIDPFAPIPLVPPGCLLRYNEQSEQKLIGHYSVTLPKDSLLVDDPDHSDDIIRRIREVLELIWTDQADAIEKEACEILGVKELRDYFRKPGKGRFLGRSHFPLLQKPPQGTDLLAASILEEKLRYLAVLPPTRQRPTLQGAGELRRTEDSLGSQPT